MVGLAIAVSGGYYYQWSWVGVDSPATGNTKTLWDWMELLLVPFVLAIGAYLLNKSAKTHELNIAQQQRENDQELAKQRSNTERELSKDRQQQSALEAYFDKMTDLLLNHDLRTSQDDDEVRVIAK